MIEPTREFGFSFLEKIQKQLKPISSAAKLLEPRDLRLPVDLYLAQKSAQQQLKSDRDQPRELKKQFARVSQLLIQRNCQQARIELEKATSSLAEPAGKQAHDK